MRRRAIFFVLICFLLLSSSIYLKREHLHRLAKPSWTNDDAATHGNNSSSTPTTASHPADDAALQDGSSCPRPPLHLFFPLHSH